MIERARWGWKGWARITVLKHDGLCPEVLGSGRCRCRPKRESEVIGNLIVDSGRNFVRDLLRNAISPGAITYCALGVNSGAVAAGQTALLDEAFRKGITKYAAGATGESIATCYVAPAEANYAIQEVGWFAGPNASSARNSGAILSRLLYAHTKTNLEALQLEHHDQF